MFYAKAISRVISIAKIGLDLFSLGLKQFWIYSVLGDCIYEVKGSGQQGIKTRASFLYLDPW